MVERPDDEIDAVAADVAAAARDQTGENGSAATSLAEVGEHVASVLTSAQQAADRMRAEARAEADRAREEARERAEATVQGAKRAAVESRAEAEEYDKNVRSSADAYSAEKRAEAEEFARRTVAGAKEEGEAVREAARVEAGRLVEAGRRRSEALAAEVRHYEERLDRLHAVFAGMTTQLAELMESGTERRRDEPASANPEEQGSDEAQSTVASGSN